ncbi:hypothetical protein Xcel_3445 (plasmid) [Xylanimonas cellulosilytica DSM 15894]|uniref:DUF2637 domain-containing protein n=1 Tax=Xylanimonas cellulosilytica (strain DSM 15894 / JCM 12276 / CECT 5975 / KCTC 9989 / LMG 20990 / NBRC 107835 / XIL07) TaxID=446471 RepID=D1C0X8_XYLCX|nr:hypothetical protein [Xylanimonas cellulosilytica]ACZ32444.1 hypothetical protein Xcel_3445 [Xylanimonas cellulosilytica DSM 15894]
MTEPSAHQLTGTSRDRRRSRRLVLTAAVAVAVISTRSAYLAMVHFGVDVVGMSTEDAWTSAGVFELSLATVALLAREAAKENRPSGTLLSLTWVLSSASGFFAAWHELYIGNPVGAALFRFTVPLLAALMWHLALIGDRHLATGTSWSETRTTARMHALFTTTETWFRARAIDDGSRSSRRSVARADHARQRARRAVLKHVGTSQIRSTIAVWLDAVDALGQGTDRVGTAVCGEVTGTAAVLTTLSAKDAEPAPAQPGPRPGRRRRRVSSDQALTAAQHVNVDRVAEPDHEPTDQPVRQAAPEGETAPSVRSATSEPTEAVRGDQLHLVEPRTLADRQPMSDEDAVVLIRHLNTEAGGPVSRRTVEKAVGCGAGRATRLMILARSDDEAGQRGGEPTRQSA